jgi:hypothetical protein
MWLLHNSLKAFNSILLGEFGCHASRCPATKAFLSSAAAAFCAAMSA